MTERLGPARGGFGRFERRLLKRMAKWHHEHPTCSPKKWQVIDADYRNDPPGRFLASGRYISHHGLTDRRAFRNLLALGLIEHSLNGHCWLTRAGWRKLGLKDQWGRR